MQKTACRISKKPLIGIIGGTGRFGQWFKLFFNKCGFACIVAGRKTKLTPLALAKKADIVIFSVPIRETIKLIRLIGPFVKPGSLLCDFSSLKREPLDEMRKCDKRVGVAGIHPLFGPFVPSLAGQNIVFCPGRNNNWVKFLKKLFKQQGGRIIEMKATEHDKQMAIIQALTHFVNLALIGVISRQKNKPHYTLSTPVFRLQLQLIKRILNSEPSLYADIEIHNKYFKSAIKQFTAETKKLGAIVAKGQEAVFEKNYRTLAQSIKKLSP